MEVDLETNIPRGCPVGIRTSHRTVLRRASDAPRDKVLS